MADIANWNPPVLPSQTVGGPCCPICGKDIRSGAHGTGICARSRYGDTQYIGITPEQVRQIVREEIRAALSESDELRK